MTKTIADLGLCDIHTIKTLKFTERTTLVAGPRLDLGYDYVTLGTGWVAKFIGKPGGYWMMINQWRSFNVPTSSQ